MAAPGAASFPNTHELPTLVMADSSIRDSLTLGYKPELLSLCNASALTRPQQNTSPCPLFSCHSGTLSPALWARPGNGTAGSAMNHCLARTASPSIPHLPRCGSPFPWTSFSPSL